MPLVVVAANEWRLGSRKPLSIQVRNEVVGAQEELCASARS
jgi:hypothetical protein